MKTIKILGAGLSGLSAAINLAKADYEVHVFEANKEVGRRFHGDLQGLQNWSEKEDILEQFRKMNIEINFDFEPVSRIIVTNSSKQTEVNSSRPLFYLVRRGSVSGSFDQSLKRQATTLGASIHFGQTIPENEANVVATGSISNEVAGIVKGIVFKTNMENTAIALFNDRAAFKGYAYLLVARGHGSMCCIVLDRLSAIDNCYEETRRIFSHMLRLDIQEPRDIGGIGSFSVKNVFEKDGALFVGEAAGLQDFLWGFGMRYAVTSGFLAARSILNSEDYAKVAGKHFGPKLKASLVNRYLWEKFGSNDYSLVVNHSRLVKDLLCGMYGYGLLQKVLYPFALPRMRKTYSKLRL